MRRLLVQNCMVKVSVTKQSNYPVRTATIKKKLADFFVKNGIVSGAEVSVAIVSEKKMLEVGKVYLKDKNLHSVLSFTPDEIKGQFVFPPDSVVHLGEIVVCYQEAVREAGKENILIDDEIYNLIEHGALHLLGIHHEE